AARIVVSSPACAPQAMLADVISVISSASCPAPSPKSQFKSIWRISGELFFQAQHQPAQVAFACEIQSVRLPDRNLLKPTGVARPQLREPGPVDRDNRGDPRIPADRLTIEQQHDRLSRSGHLNRPATNPR